METNNNNSNNNNGNNNDNTDNSTPLVLKKKRGRPRKNSLLTAGGEVSVSGGGAGVTPVPAEPKPPKAPKPTNNEVMQSAEVKKSLIGQPVHGVVDGSFDAGYLVTVRIGDSERLYRGVVFGPGLSVPLSKGVDIAPRVKVVRTEDGVATPSANTGVTDYAPTPPSSAMDYPPAALPTMGGIAYSPSVPIPTKDSTMAAPYSTPEFPKLAHRPSHDILLRQGAYQNYTPIQPGSELLSGPASNI